MSDVRQLLAESWTPIDRRGDDLARYVFARLFLAHPRTRELFPVAMDTQHAQLLTAIATTIRLYDDPDAVDFYLRALGHEHRRYGLRRQHFETLGEALLDGVREFGGPDWRPAYDDAWQQVLRLVTATILASGLDVTSEPAYREAEIVAHRRVGADLAVLTLAPDAPVAHEPGQYLPVETPYQPGEWREFAIGNAPRADHTLDLHVQAVAGGLVSGPLVRRARIGDRLRLAEPAGDLLLDRRSTRDIVCVAAGTGVAAIRALVEQLVSYNRTRWVSLFVGGQHRDDLYDLASLRQLTARHPWLSLVPVVADDRAFPAEHGTVAQVVEHYGPWPDHDCFIAGPVAPVRATVGVLTRLGVPAERIRQLPYGAEQLAVPAVRAAVPAQAQPVGDVVAV
jgi:NAD(P)H-flavin reductase/hemoglobin-like flavoprotein